MQSTEPSTLFTHWQNHLHSHLYAILLVVILSLLTTAAALSGTKPGLIACDALFFVVVFLIACSAFSKQKKFFFSFILGALLSTSLDVASIFAVDQTLHLLLEALAGTSYAALLIASIALITHRLTHTKRTTIDTVFGGICVYLLLAFLWYVAYDLLQSFDPTAFNFTFKRKGEYDLMYFSINTLTTLGHGDIVPMNRIAMVLCNLEAVVGQIFPAVFIAKLVSLHVNDDQRKTEQALQEESEQTDRTAT